VTVQGLPGQGFTVQFVPIGAQRVVPWRNGAGSTREVAIDPPDASVDSGFRWRVSMAGVAVDGPFSAFPGVDRSLWLLRGGGLELAMDGQVLRLDQPLQRIDFAGETHVHARLLDGPTDDLNVMVSRGEVRAAAEVQSLDAGDDWQRDLTAGEHLILALGGSLAVAGLTLALGDAVRLTGLGRCRAVAVTSATFLCVSFA
jgi:uncharacterized protein